MKKKTAGNSPEVRVRPWIYLPEESDPVTEQQKEMMDSKRPNMSGVFRR